MASAATKITFTCPNCAKVLRSSTRPPAEKKIKCPACGEAFLPELDDDEVSEATAIQSKPSAKTKAKAPPRDEDDDEDAKPRSKKKRADEEDNEDDGPPRRKRTRDDDDDDRPIKKKKKAKKKSGSMMLMVLGVVFLGGGALLSCGLCGVGAFVWPGFLTSKKADLEAFVPPDANLVMGGNPKVMKAKFADLEKLILQGQPGAKREEIEMGNSEQMLMFTNTHNMPMKMTIAFVSNAADIDKIKGNQHLGAAQTLGGHANVHKVGPEGKKNGIEYEYFAFLPGNVVVAGNGDQASFIATLDRGKKPAQPNAALKLSRSVDKAPFWVAVAADAKGRDELKKALGPNPFMPQPPAVAKAAGAVDGVEGLTVAFEISDNQDLKISATVPCKNADDAGKIKTALDESWKKAKQELQNAKQNPFMAALVPQSIINDLNSIEFGTQGSSATAKMKLSGQSIQELAKLGLQQQKNFGPPPKDFGPPKAIPVVMQVGGLAAGKSVENVYQFQPGNLKLNWQSQAPAGTTVELTVLSGAAGENAIHKQNTTGFTTRNVNVNLPAAGLYRVRIRNLGPNVVNANVLTMTQ